jgi:hypothetical protein
VKDYKEKKGRLEEVLNWREGIKWNMCVVG